MDFIELNNCEDADSIEACRTCGIYYILNHVHPIFTKTGAGENFSMLEIIQTLNEWDLQIKQNDGRPQYMCVVCIGLFQKMMQFKRNCVETQEQFGELENKRAHNGLIIKREIELPDEPKFCAFIYLDTDDEGEEAGSEEDGSKRVCAPFDIPHVPIKEEHTARVPQETKYKYQPTMPAVVSNLPEEATFAQVKPEELAAANGFRSTLFEDSPKATEIEDSDDEIIKFTYEDGDDDGGEQLPMPIHEPGVYCKLCGHASADQKLHIEHMERVHMLKDCECHICGKKFTNAQQSRLKFHMKWHKLQQHLKCPICGFYCNSKDTLKEHKLAVHTRKKCRFCGKKIKCKLLQAHINRHILENEEESKEEEARKLSSLQDAAETLATIPQDIIQCAFCEYTVVDAEQLQEHVLTTHRVQEEPAEPEFNSESDPAQLQTILVQTESSSQPAVISEAETSTNDIQDSSMLDGSIPDSYIHDSSNSSLQNINIDVSTERPNKSMCACEICGKQFDLKIKLNRHLKLHNKTPF